MLLRANQVVAAGFELDRNVRQLSGLVAGSEINAVARNGYAGREAERSWTKATIEAATWFPSRLEPTAKKAHGSISAKSSSKRSTFHRKMSVSLGSASRKCKNGKNGLGGLDPIGTGTGFTPP